MNKTTTPEWNRHNIFLTEEDLAIIEELGLSEDEFFAMFEDCELEEID